MHVIRDEEDGKLINFQLLVLLFFVFVSKRVGVGGSPAGVRRKQWIEIQRLRCYLIKSNQRFL
jgi:hypothetical protein